MRPASGGALTCGNVTAPHNDRMPWAHPTPGLGAQVAALATTSAPDGRSSQPGRLGRSVASDAASTSRKVAATIAAARSASSRGRNGPCGTSSGQNRT